MNNFLSTLKVTFALGRTVQPQYITSQTDRRRQTDGTLYGIGLGLSATVQNTVG